MVSKRVVEGLFRCVIMGPAGAGKGTVSERILKHFPLIHISCGDLIRAHIRKKTAFGETAIGYIKQGKLVPDKLVTEITLLELHHHDGENWLLDGFPRTVVQANALQKLIPVQSAMCLDVPFDVIIDRLSKRWIHAPSGRIYNLDFDPPKIPGKDDDTGEPLVQREDDKPETILARLKSYKQWEVPVADYFNGLYLLHKFSGTTTAAIWPKVFDYLSTEVTPIQPFKQY